MIIKRMVNFQFLRIKNYSIQSTVRALVNKADNNTNLENEITKNLMDTEWNAALPYETIPGPTKFSIVARFLPGGKYYNLARANLMRSLFDEYGEIVRLIGQFGKRDTVVVRNPKNFEKIFRTEGIWPYRVGLETLAHYRTVKNPEPFMNIGGLLAEQKEVWANFRSIVNPVLMQQRNINMYTEKMGKVADDFINKIRQIRDSRCKEVPGTFNNVMSLWALETISVVALDTRLGLLKEDAEDNDAKKLLNALSQFFELTIELDMNPSIWRWIKTPKYNQLMKAYDDLTEVTYKYVTEAIKRFDNDKSNDRSENEKSVLEKLIKYDKKVAVVMAMDMLLAGVDSTQSALCGCLLALAKNPEKQAILREEIRNILPTKNTPLTTENMKYVSYLKACIKESLRLYPVAQGTIRAVGQNIAINGYQIPKRTDVLMVAEYENTDFEYDRTYEFIPERWLRAQKDVQKPPVTKISNPFAYLPFGIGPRSCIGKRLVEMELSTVIAKIIRNFQVEFNYPVEDVFTLKLIFIPEKELKFKFTDISE